MRARAPAWAEWKCEGALLAHLSQLGWEHVNLTGDYIWSAVRPATENSDGFRPLRAAPDAARKAA